MAYNISRENFEDIARKALQELPEEFIRLMKNVSIVVEDLPSHEEAQELGVPRYELLGLFSGMTQAEQEMFFDLPPALPDRIVLYQKNIEAICDTEQELEHEIRLTLLHEAGHYFGLSEEELQQYE